LPAAIVTTKKRRLASTSGLLRGARYTQTHCSAAVFLELLDQPVEDGRRLQFDALQNVVLRVDQRRLRGDEEAAKAGVARAGGSTPVLNQPEPDGRARPLAWNKIDHQSHE